MTSPKRDKRLISRQETDQLLAVINRTPIDDAVLCRRAQLYPAAISDMRGGRRPQRWRADALRQALGMRLSPEGELEWDDSLAAAVARPGALRDQFSAYRQQAYAFVADWRAQFLGDLRRAYLADACERGLITKAQWEALSASET